MPGSFFFPMDPLTLNGVFAEVTSTYRKIKKDKSALHTFNIMCQV